jgi:hypothetical protein
MHTVTQVRQNAMPGAVSPLDFIVVDKSGVTSDFSGLWRGFAPRPQPLNTTKSGDRIFFRADIFPG